MIIFVLSLALSAQLLVGGAVLIIDGGWLLALVSAQGAGCAAVLGAATIGNASQHICKTVGASRAS